MIQWEPVLGKCISDELAHGSVTIREDPGHRCRILINNSVYYNNHWWTCLTEQIKGL